MSNVFWIENQWLQEGQQPAVPNILAIGDSWFWYPMPGGNLLTYLGPLVQPRGRIIYAVGNNGAEATDYTDGKYAKKVRRALEVHGAGLTEVFFSGGGNDFAGFSDLLPLLRGDCSGATTAADCFLPGPDWPSLPWLMRKVSASMTRLFDLIDTHAPSARIYLHNYDIPYPDGRSVFKVGDGWIRGALLRAKVPPELQRPCVRHVLERLTSMQAALVQRNGGRVLQVDSHGVLLAEDWANELHPTPGGFEKIAQKAWRPLLQAHGAA